MPRQKKVTVGAHFTGGKRGRKSRLSGYTYTDLQNELRRRESMLQGLMTQRQQINQQLQVIDQQIAAEGGTVPTGDWSTAARPRRGRPPGSGKAKWLAAPKHGRRGPGRPRGSLVESLHKVLTGTQMSVVNVCDAVKKAGYQTTSPNFRTIVNAALLANPSVFKKIERGVYTAK